MSEPTVDLILRRFDKGQARLSRFYEAFEESEMFYEGNWEPEGPESMPKTVPATAFAIVEEATDHVDVEHITAHVPTIGKKGQNEAQAGKIKLFIRGMWNYWSGHAEDIPPARDFTKNLFLGNKAIFRVLVDWDAWPEPDIPEGTKKAEADEIRNQMRDIRAMNFPVVCNSISPRYFIDDPTIGRKRWAMEFYNKDADDVRELYGDWADPRKREKPSEKSLYDADNVEIIDYWEEGTQPAKEEDVDAGLAKKVGDEVSGCWRVIIGDHILAKGPSWLAGYPLPYVIKYGGSGRESRDGHHEKKGRGILHPIRSLLRAEGRRLTQLDAITAFYATPVLFAEGEESEWNFKWEPGWLNFRPQGRDTPEAPNVPQPHAALLATIAQIQAGMERGTFGSVVRGEKQAGTRSAAEHAILSAQAELRFRPAKRAVEDAIREVNEKTLLLLKNVILKADDPVIVPTADDTMESPPRLKASDIPTPFYHRIELEDTSPSAVSREALVGVQLHQEGAIDDEEMMTRAGIENTADMKQRVRRDRIMKLPYVEMHLGRELVESFTGEPVEEMEFQEALIQAHQGMRLQQAQGINQGAAPIGVGAMQGQGASVPGGPEEMVRTIQGMGQIGRPTGTPA